MQCHPLVTTLCHPLVTNDKRMARDRQTTEQQLIAATGRVLAHQGFGKLGVNAIAREAGVDKVLIYRYFDGLSGLMRAYAEQGDFWPSADELLAGVDQISGGQPISQQFSAVMHNYVRALRGRPLTLQILSWEMVERNELTAYLEEVREQQGLALTGALAAIAEHRPEVDVAALASLVSAAINYLAARSQHIKHFNGIDITDDAGWQRLERTIAQLAEALLRSPDSI